MKLSYSCCPNVQSLIAQHSRRLLSHNKGRSTTAKPQSSCNCRKPELCPLQGNCLQDAIIYRATVSSGEGDRFYVGATEQTFKKRYPKHKEALAKKNSKNATSLSNYVWSLRERGITPTVRWEILKKCRPYVCGSRKCDVCLSEKALTLDSDPSTCLNKNTELMQKCRHSNKHKLKAIGVSGIDPGG